MRSPVRTLFSLLFAAVYFTGQVVFASATETNFWSERQQRISSDHRSNKPTSQQFAALSPSFNTDKAANPQTLLGQLPSIAPTLPSTTTPDWGYSEKTKAPALSNTLQALVNSVPLTHGSIQNVFQASNDENPPVLLIQDVHLNPEAQENIASILQELVSQKQVHLIGVEGAFQPFNFSQLRLIAGNRTAKTVAEKFLDKNRISAPSFVGITSPIDPPSIVGIDDEEHYEKNVEAYLQAQEVKSKAVSEIAEIKKSLGLAKRKYFGPDLFTFDALRTAHHKGEIGFGPYVKKLKSLDPTSDFVIDQFLEAYQMESTIDFNTVDQERKKVIEKLAERLDQQETSDLLARSLSYKMGRLGFGHYYQGLRNLCQKKGISLQKTPAFDNYIRYVLLSDGIKADQLFSSVQKLEEHVLKRSAKTWDEEKVARIGEQVDLIEKLLEFSLTPSEWTAYLKGERQLEALATILGQMVGHAPRPNNEFVSLSAFEDFYREADIRSERMVEKLKATPSVGARVLVTGGFHTNEIVDLLRDQRISYVVVSPKITRVEAASGNSYLSIFAREKTPLEKLFSGHKLFINPASVAAVGSYASDDLKALPNLRRQLKLAKETENELLGEVGITNPDSGLDDSGLASIADKKLRDMRFDRNHPVLYALYTIFGINWEIVFQLTIPAALYVFGVGPIVGLTALIISAAAFSLGHPDRSRRKFVNLFIVGLVLGAFFLFPSLGFWNAVYVSMALHSLHNFAKWMGWLPDWMHMASVTEKETETDEERQDRFKRLSTYALEQIYFERGKLADNHPITIYVREIFKEALKEEADNYTVVIAPEWNEVNALALPDGTILVGAGLLKLVEYKEELMAVLAHEAMHIKRRHAEIRDRMMGSLKGKSLKDMPKALLQMAGLSRLQEYEADLRWIFQEMQKKNVNPYGQVIFMEKLQAREERAGYQSRDIAHGYIGDRALNTESLFFYLPVDSLSHKLTRIPDNLMTALPKPSEFRRAGFMHTPTYIRDKDQRNQMEEERIKMADEVSVAHLGFAINGIYDGLTIEDKQGRVANKKIMRRLTDRVDAEIFKESGWPDDAIWPLARILYYELYAAIPYLFPKAPHSSKALEEARENDEQALSTAEDIERLVVIMEMEKFRDILHVGIGVSPYGLTQKIFSSYMEKLNLKEDPTLEKIDRALTFASSWAKAMEGLYKSKGLVSISVSDVFQQAAEQLYRGIPAEKEVLRKDLWSKAEKTGFLIKKEAPKSVSEGREKNVKAGEIATLILRKTKLRQPYQHDNFADIFEMISQELKDKTAKDAVNFFDDLAYNSWLRYGPKMIDAAMHDTEYEYEVEQVKSRLARYNTFRLFEKALDHFLQFGPFSTSARDSLRLRLLQSVVYGHGMVHDAEEHLRLLINMHSGEVELIEFNMPEWRPAVSYFSYEEVSEGGRSIERIDVISSEDRDYLDSHYLKAVEKTWMLPERTRDEIIDLYRFLYLGEFGGDMGKLEPPNVNQKVFLDILSKYLGSIKNWNDFFKEIEKLEKAGVPVSDLIIKNKGRLSYALSQLWAQLPSKPTKKQLEQINKAVEFIQDPLMRQELQSYYYEKVWPVLTFDEKLDIFFEKTSQGVFDFPRFNDFVENEAKTEDQCRKVLDRLERELDAFLSKSAWEAGVAAILSNMNLARAEDRQDLMLGLLESEKSDAKLKKVLYDSIKEWQEFLDPTQNLTSERTSEAEIIQDYNARVRAAGSVEEALFSMGAMSKTVLLRKLLTGSAGLISNPQQRLKFFQSLINASVQKGKEEELMEVIEHVVASMGTTSAWKPLYFAIQAFLLDKIAVPTERPVRWTSVAEPATDPSQSNIKIEDLPRRSLKDLSRSRSKNSTHPWRHVQYFSELSREVLRSQFLKVGLLESPERAGSLTPLAFSLDLAQNAGSLGVRFLQVLPQFADLKEEYADQFSRVYDAMYGQSKLTALAVLEDKWPRFWDDVESIDGRIGGGSLMTVYKIKMKRNSYHPQFSGKTLVVKVRNPNLEFHLENNVRLVREVLDELIKRHGARYQTARIVLEEVREWINRDVNFLRFAEKDRQFKKNNDGFTGDGLNYEIFVPQSYEIPAKEGEQKDPDKPEHLMIEEFVDGEKLTQKWEELERKGHDLKSIVGLLAKNYIYQMANGIVHSDVHIGNFLIVPAEREGEKNKIFILDRNLFLELKPDVRKVINPLAELMKLMSTSSEKFIDQLISLSKATVNPDKRQEMIAAWERNKRAVGEGTWNFDRTNDLRLIAELVPEVKDLVDFLVDPTNVAMLPADVFVDRLISLAKSTVVGEKREQMIAAWKQAKADLFSGRGWKGIRDFFSNLDSNLELPSDTVAVLKPIMNLVNTMTETPQEFVDKVIEISETKRLEPTKRERLIRSWEGALSEIRKGNWKALNHFLINLRASGLKLPLEVTLVLKNISSLQAMSHRAGFSNGILGALAYSGKVEDTGTVEKSGVNERVRKARDPTTPSAKKKRKTKGDSPASILDTALKKSGFDQRHPILYALYTIIGVNWEILFQSLIPAAMFASPGTPGLGLIIWILSAGLFALAHPDRSVGKFVNLFIVGLGLGAPFLFPTLGFFPALFVSMGFHSFHNFLKWMGWLPNWMHMASVITADEPLNRKVQMNFSNGRSTNDDLIEKLQPFLTQRGSPELLKRVLIEVVQSTELNLDIANLPDVQRTGTQFGDISEVVSRGLEGRLELRQFSTSLRYVLTGEADNGRELFAGSYSALFRQLGDPQPQAPELRNPEIIYQLLDGPNRQRALALARKTLQELGARGIPAKVAFLVKDESLIDLLQSELRIPSDVEAKFFTMSNVSSLSKSIEAGFIEENDLKDRSFRFIAPESLKDVLKAFIDIPNLDPARFRIYLMLTNVLNPLTVEFQYHQLDDLKEKTEHILRQA